jgi:hypothetical protein
VSILKACIRSALSCALPWTSLIDLLRRRASSFISIASKKSLTAHCSSSDPVIEPMLQSIPDPFDSYGPPQSEDQIFSILAPLSIMNTSNGPSTNGSPLPTPIPELDPIEGLPSVSNHTWMAPPSGTIAFPGAPPDWEDDKSPSSSTPRSISPPSSNRKHLAPLNSARHPRKSESKLRSVLSPIDETRSRQMSEDARAASIMNTLNPSPPPIETSESHSWSFVYGKSGSPHEDSEDRDGKTPTHSTFPRSPTPPRPPLHDPGAERSEPDRQVPIAT